MLRAACRRASPRRSAPIENPAYTRFGGRSATASCARIASSWVPRALPLLHPVLEVVEDLTVVQVRGVDDMSCLAELIGEDLHSGPQPQRRMEQHHVFTHTRCLPAWPTTANPATQATMSPSSRLRSIWSARIRSSVRSWVSARAASQSDGDVGEPFVTGRDACQGAPQQALAPHADREQLEILQHRRRVADRDRLAHRPEDAAHDAHASLQHALVRPEFLEQAPEQVPFLLDRRAHPSQEALVLPVELVGQAFCRPQADLGPGEVIVQVVREHGDHPWSRHTPLGADRCAGSRRSQAKWARTVEPSSSLRICTRSASWLTIHRP